MSTIESVAVVGPGGVGGLLAALLARTGTKVTCIGTERSTAHLRTHPLVVKSHRFGDFEAPVGAATRADGDYDAVLLTVKATQLRGAVQRMAKSDVTALLVVNPADQRHLVGMVALHHLLEARARHLEDEERRERVLPWEYILPQWIRPKLARENPR